MSTPLRLLSIALLWLLSISAQAATYFVNATTGDDSRTPSQAQNAATPWRSISNAITLASNGDVIQVASGTYTNPLNINKRLSILGATSPKPVIAPTSGFAAIIVDAKDITLSNLEIRVNQVFPSVGISTRGNGDNGDRSIAGVAGSYSGLEVRNCDIFSTGVGTGSSFETYGIRLFGGLIATNNPNQWDTVTIAGCRIRPLNVATNLSFGRCIRLEGPSGVIGGAGADSNSLYSVSYGIQLGSVRSGAINVINNGVVGKVELNNIVYNNQATNSLIENNRFAAVTGSLEPHLVEVKQLINNQATTTVRNNRFSNIILYGCGIRRASNVVVSNNTFQASATAPVGVVALVEIDSKQTTTATDAPRVSNNITIQGNTLSAPSSIRATGIQVRDANSSAAASYNSYTNVTIGGAGALANNFGGGLFRFISLKALQGQSSDIGEYATSPSTTVRSVRENFDASNNVFGLSGNVTLAPGAMSSSQLFEVENKIEHRSDFDSLGFVTVFPNRIYHTDSSRILARNVRGTFPGMVAALTNGGQIITSRGDFQGQNVTFTRPIAVVSSVPLVLNNLTVNTASATDLSDFSNSTEIRGNLTLTSGILAAQRNLTVMGNVIGGSANSYVRTASLGALRRRVTNAATIFPVGSTNGYAPVAATDVASSNDTLSVTVRATDSRGFFSPPLASGITKFVRHNWAITERTVGGGSYNLSFGWDASAIQGTLTPTATNVIGVSLGANYNEFNTVTGNTASLSSQSALSTYAVYNTDRVPGLTYYVRATSGDDARSASQARSFNTAWRTITRAIQGAGPGDIIVVEGDGASYSENITIDKSLTLRDTCPATGTGNGRNRPEIRASATSSERFVIRVAAEDITIRGMRILTNQNDVVGNGNTAVGIFYDTLTNASINNLVIEDNQILGTNISGALNFNSYGIRLEGRLLVPGEFGERVTIRRNTIAPINLQPNGVFGRGIRLRGFYGTIGGATLADSNRIGAYYNIQWGNANGGPVSIRNNSFNGIGALLINPLSSVPVMEFSNNIVNGFNNSTIENLIEVRDNTQGVPMVIEGNRLFNFLKTAIFSSRSANVTVRNNTITPVAGARNYRHLYVNTKQNSTRAVNFSFTNGIRVLGNTFNGSGAFGGVGVQIANDDDQVGTLPYDTLVFQGNRFDGDMRRFVMLDAGGGSGLQSAGASDTLWNTSGIPVSASRAFGQSVDFSQNQYRIGSQLLAPSAMTLAQLFTLENRVQHGIDFDSIGVAIMVPFNLYVSDSSFVNDNLDFGAARAALDTRSRLFRGTSACDDNFTLWTQGNSFDNSDIATVDRNITLRQATRRPITTGGVRMNATGRALTIKTNLRLTNILDLNQAQGGLISTDSFAVALAPTATISGGNANSYVATGVRGRVLHENIGSRALAFPVGTATTYAPVTFQDANNTTDSIKVSVRPAATTDDFTPVLPNTIPTFAALQWDITEGAAGGSSANVSFSYPTGAVVNGPLDNNVRIAHFVGGEWTYQPATINGLTASSTVPFTSFSPFAVLKSPDPIITGAIAPRVLCAGDSATVTITSSDPLAPNNVFTIELSDASGGFAAPVQIGTVTASDDVTRRVRIPVGTATGINYRIRIRSSNPVLTSAPSADSIRITARPANPTITAVPASGQVCQGDSVVLTAPAGFTYQWSTGETTARIVVRTSQRVTLRVSANGCPSDTVGFSVIVLPKPAAPTVLPAGPLTICAGETATLTVQGGPFAQYRWTNGATTESINVTTSGLYRVAVQQAGGCFSDSSIAVRVTVLPAPPAPSVTANGPTALCAGDSVTLRGPIGAAGYIWSNGARTQTITVRTSGNFTLRIIGANGCTSAVSSPTAVVVNPRPAAPAITASGSTTICPGNTVTLRGPAGFLSYRWIGPAGLIADGPIDSISVSTAGDYRLIVRDGNGCASDSSAATTITVSPAPEAPVITARGATSICSGDSVVLEGPAGLIYVWSNGATSQNITVRATGVYTLQVRNAAGCLSPVSNAINVTVAPQPAAPLITSDRLSICEGQSAIISGPGGVAQYLWSTGATTPAITVTTAGSYTLRIVTAQGCTSAVSAPITINLNVGPVPAVSSSDANNRICQGDQVILTSNFTTGNRWNTGDTTASITVFNPGTFTVTVTDQNGCVGTSAPLVIVVDANPVVSIGVANNDTIISLGASSELTANVAPVGNYTYNWLNGLSTTEGISSPTAATTNVTPTSSTIYIVEVTNAETGCTALDTINIRVSEGIFVPNYFSPSNGDNLNPTLKLFGIQGEVDGFEFKVFDRFNNEVFASTDPFFMVGTGWDGTKDGSRLPADTYFWTIKGKYRRTGRDLSTPDRKYAGQVAIGR